MREQVDQFHTCFLSQVLKFPNMVIHLLIIKVKLVDLSRCNFSSQNKSMQTPSFVCTSRYQSAVLQFHKTLFFKNIPNVSCFWKLSFLAGNSDYLVKRIVSTLWTKCTFEIVFQTWVISKGNYSPFRILWYFADFWISYRASLITALHPYSFTSRHDSSQFSDALLRLLHLNAAASPSNILTYTNPYFSCV